MAFAFKYCTSVPSQHRESIDSLIYGIKWGRPKGGRDPKYLHVSRWCLNTYMIVCIQEQEAEAIFRKYTSKLQLVTIYKAVLKWVVGDTTLTVVCISNYISHKVFSPIKFCISLVTPLQRVWDGCSQCGCRCLYIVTISSVGIFLGIDLCFKAVHGVFMTLFKNEVPQRCEDVNGGLELRGRELGGLTIPRPPSLMGKARISRCVAWGGSARKGWDKLRSNAVFQRL